MTFNLFSPPTKDDIRVGYIDPNLGYVEGFTICQANEYASKNPGTTFVFRNGNNVIQYLNVNEVNQLDPNVLISTDECGGINQRKECGPPNIQMFGGGGIGAAGNPVIGRDGALLAVDIVRGGNGYQYPPIVAARDNCNYGSGATLTAVLGEVAETIETYENESDFEDYEICEPTDVGYGRRYGPNGEDLGPWEPRSYTQPGEDPIRNEIEEYERIVRRLARAPFWTTRNSKPTKVTCSDARVIPSKYDVTDKTFVDKQLQAGSKNPLRWGDFMNSYAISPVPPSNVRGSDFAGRLFTFEWTENFPLDGEYTFRGLCDNKAQLYIDNLKVTDIRVFDNPGKVIKKPITKGIHNIRVDLLNIPIQETILTQRENALNLKNQKIFNTIDYIGKADRTLWRTNTYGRGGFINEFGVCPFDTSISELPNNPYAGTHRIVWRGVNFPVDGSYRIRIAVDDNVTLTIGDQVTIRKNGFVPNTDTSTPDFNESRIMKAGTYDIVANLEQKSGGKFGFGTGKGINPMALAIDIETTTVTETIISPKSWNENPMGISLTIDAPEPTSPKEPAPVQEGRCPPNPIWTTRFPGAKETWYPVKYNRANTWSKFMNRYAISPVKPLDTPGSDISGSTFTNSWDIDIPYDGFYGVCGTRDNTGRILIDGTEVSELNGFSRENPDITKVFITKGRHTISVEVFNQPVTTETSISQKIFRTKDWQIESKKLTQTTGDGVTYEGPPLFAYKDNRWGEFMNNHSVSPLLLPLDAENPEINGVKKYIWRGVNFPESGQYDIAFQADNDASLLINGIKVLSSQGYEGPAQIFKVNVTQGKYDVVVECNNIPDRTNIFRNNPTGFGIVIRKNVTVRNTQSTPWSQNPVGISAVLIPPPCPRRIRGRGVVTDVIVNDPGNGYLRPIPQEQGYPVALRLKEVIVENPGINYNCGVDELRITPSNGAELDYICDPFGKIREVKVLNPGLGFTEYPEIRLISETGVNASFRPVFEVVRDPIVLPEKLIQVTDLVGLKQTGYVNGRPYYGAVYYDQGVRYAGFYETVGDPVQVYDTLQESITAQVTTAPNAIQRQGTDITNNDPRLNIPGTPQNLI